MKGGKVKMRKTAGAIVLSLVLILAIGAFASITNATVLNYRDSDVARADNYHPVTQSSKVYRTAQDADATVYSTQHRADNRVAYTTTNAGEVVTETGEYTTVSETGDIVTQSGDIVEEKEYNVKPNDATPIQRTATTNVRRNTDLTQNAVAEDIRPKDKKTSPTSVGKERSEDEGTVDSVKEKPKEDTVFSTKGVKGDINNDGFVDFGDINWFTMVYYNQWYFKEYEPELFWRTDLNDDGFVDRKDVNLFVALLTQ